MKKRIQILATAAVAAMSAFADTVDPTQAPFYFESKDETGVRSKPSYEWDVSVRPGKTARTSGTTTFQAILAQPFTTVEDWGLSDTMNIAAAAWQGVASTNFTYTHETGDGTKYLYMFVRYFRYNLTLDAGAGDPSSYVTNNICYTNSIALPEPTRTGYDFLGWTNNTLTAALTGEQTGAGLQVQEDGEPVVLYAKWEPKTFTVTFDPNGEGATVDPSEKTVTYDSTYGELPTPVWANHGFVGWFTNATEEVQIQSNTVVSITENQTLYAKWSQLYTVTFQNSDGSIIYKQYTDVVSGTRVAPPDISEVTAPEGKIFTGKWDSSEYENVTRNLIILPVFTDIETTLAFSCDPTAGGSISRENHGASLYEYGRMETLTVTPNAAYDFVGWSDGSTDNPHNVRVIISTNLVARFTLKKFTVDFLDWDGTTTNDTRIVEYGSAADAPTPIEHPGYTFTGWSADINSVTSNMTVVAQYAANQYVVLYDANGGTGSMTNEVFTYGMEYQLQSNTYTRAVNQFFGWASTPGAATNEVEYFDGATVSNLTAIANGTNTLYAVWCTQLSDLSVAANCTNLILTCSNADQLWEVDATTGYAGGSSVKTAGSKMSKMTAEAAGVGTVTFWTKTISPGVLVFNEKPQGGISTDGEWKFYSFELGDAESFLWRGTMYDDDSAVCWVDQIHWYPNRFVAVESNKLTDEEKDIIKEAIFQNWNMILGVNEANVSQVRATGADVTNAVALLANRIMPDVAIDGDTAELTFKNDGEVWKEPVTVPSIESVAYTGEPLTATVPDSEQYAIVSNEGGTTAGVYSVVLELTDTDRYRWAGGDSNPTSLTFTITQAVNKWVVEPSMAGWTSGETPSEPNLGEAKFGTAVVTYGELGAVRPTDPGNYVATFTVDETDNYTGLTKAVPFSIVSAGEMSAAEKAFEGWPVTVAPNGAGGWKVTLTNDIDTAALPIEIPDNLGSVTIDLNGHDLLGGEGQPALRIKPGEGDGALTVLTVNGSGSTVQGGEGAPAIAVADRAKDGVMVNVGAGVTLEGGGVPAIDGAEIGTNEGNIQKVDVTVPTVAGKEYNGQRQTADVSETGPYTVTDEGGTDVGDYSVTLTLVDTNCYCWAGGDSNPTSLTYTITRKDIAGAEIVLGPSLKYTGEEQTQTVQRVTIGGLDVTYTVSGNAATETGSYTLTVVGSGNFNGSATASWTIYPDLPPSPWSTDTDGAYNPLVANVYDGYILDDDGALAGIIQVKAAKQAVKTTTDRVTKEKTVTTNVAVTATVTDANGKKWSYSKGVGTIEGVVTGLVCTTKGVLVSKFDVSLGANGLSGEWGDLAVVGARNGMGTKGDPMKADLEENYKKSWSVTFTNETDMTRLQLVVGAKGSTKISGTTADGFKVFATVQGVMGEEAFFVPYRATLKSGKLSRSANVLLTLDKDGMVDVRTSDLGALKAGGPTTDAIDVLPYAESASPKGGEVYAGAVVLNDLAYPAKFAAKGLPAGLKINAATGAITGTPTKPGHYVATVTITSGINAKAKTVTTVEFDIANYTDDLIPVDDVYSGYCVGVKVFEPIDAALGCKVSGLPAGLKFASKETKDATFGVVPAGTVYGVPTKAGEYTVYFKKSEKVKNEQGKTVTVNHQASATFVIDPLPAWAHGTFYGGMMWVTDAFGTADPYHDIISTFTISSAGKLSGKMIVEVDKAKGTTKTMTVTAPAIAGMEFASVRMWESDDFVREGEAFYFDAAFTMDKQKYVQRLYLFEATYSEGVSVGDLLFDRSNGERIEGHALQNAWGVKSFDGVLPKFGTKGVVIDYSDPEYEYTFTIKNKGTIAVTAKSRTTSKKVTGTGQLRAESYEGGAVQCWTSLKVGNIMIAAGFMIPVDQDGNVTADGIEILEVDYE